MSLNDLCPEETLALAFAISIGIYKTYPLNDVRNLGEFFFVIAQNLTAMAVRADALKLQEIEDKRKNLKDNENLEERLKLLEDLLLSFR